MKKMADVPEKTIFEKEEKIKEVGGFDDNTIKYMEFYRYNVPFIDKVYAMAVDAEKWRNREKKEG